MTKGSRVVLTEIPPPEAIKKTAAKKLDVGREGVVADLFMDSYALVHFDAVGKPGRAGARKDVTVLVPTRTLAELSAAKRAD